MYLYEIYCPPKNIFKVIILCESHTKPAQTSVYTREIAACRLYNHKKNVIKITSYII